MAREYDQKALGEHQEPFCVAPMYVLEMPGISMAAKLVACGHAAHVGRERFAQELPNISKLARELGMTRSTVRRAVRDLVAADVLDGE